MDDAYEGQLGRLERATDLLDRLLQLGPDDPEKLGGVLFAIAVPRDIVGSDVRDMKRKFPKGLNA
jgi:hypothetical protein